MSERYVIELIDARTGVPTGTIREVVFSREEARRRVSSLLLTLRGVPVRPVIRKEK